METNHSHTKVHFQEPLKKSALLAAVFFCILFSLTGCLDLPDDPETGNKIERISLTISQPGTADSTILKIHPGDSATLVANVYPQQFRDEITIQWYYTDAQIKKNLGKGLTYGISKNFTLLPNYFIATDNEGNELVEAFEIIVNSPPKLSETTIPANGDTLWGSPNMAFLFQWESSDDDANYGRDSLHHILQIDSDAYSIGPFTHVMQSGFSTGKHSFRVIVEDARGDSDTLDTRTFYVYEKAGGQP
ncbi:MAG: hypothetical protein MJY47_04315 [Fibrobacter sp.]|nr:hypothetical protein [Fibrobacter sp.]